MHTRLKTINTHMAEGRDGDYNGRNNNNQTTKVRLTDDEYSFGSYEDAATRRDMLISNSFKVIEEEFDKMDQTYEKIIQRMDKFETFMNTKFEKMQGDIDIIFASLAFFAASSAVKVLLSCLTDS